MLSGPHWAPSSGYLKKGLLLVLLSRGGSCSSLATAARFQQAAKKKLKANLGNKYTGRVNKCPYIVAIWLYIYMTVYSGYCWPGNNVATSNRPEWLYSQPGIVRMYLLRRRFTLMNTLEKKRCLIRVKNWSVLCDPTSSLPFKNISAQFYIACPIYIERIQKIRVVCSAKAPSGEW